MFSQVGFEKINPRIFFLEEKHAWKKTWKKRKRMKGVACVFPPVAGDVLENFPPPELHGSVNKTSGKCWSRTGGP